jgi:hypothetical protein
MLNQLRSKNLSKEVLLNEHSFPSCLVAYAKEIDGYYHKREVSVNLLRGELNHIWKEYILNVTKLKGMKMSFHLKSIFPRTELAKFHEAKSNWHLCRDCQRSIEKKFLNMYKLINLEDKESLSQVYEFISASRTKDAKFNMDGAWVNYISPGDVAEILTWKLLNSK